MLHPKKYRYNQVLAISKDYLCQNKQKIEANIATILPNLIEAKSWESGEILYYIALYSDMDTHTCTQQNPLIVCKATTDPNILYLHQAMKQNNRKYFRTVMQKEVDDRMKYKNFSVIHKSKI